MNLPILIKTQNQTEIIINESQICSVIRGEDDLSIIKMSNGDEFHCIDPPFTAWKNDIYMRKS